MMHKTAIIMDTQHNFSVSVHDRDAELHAYA